MMKKNKYINTVIKLIERSLSQEISPEAIAKANYVSLRQLYRDFYAYTGHSIKEYIRKRRISIACEKLKSSNIPLSIIADESGSKTQQAFHKQFKSIVGMTPFEYKQSNTYFYFHPYTVDEISIAVRIGMENIPTCMTTKYYDSCFTGIEDKAIASIGEYNGRVFGKNGVQIANRFCYEVMTETDSPTYEWQATIGNYASCVVNYTEREINEGWNYLYNIWLPTSMFEQASEEYFEEYLFRDGRPYKLKLYLPVKKRKAPQHISITKLSEMTFVVARERGKDAERKASARVIHLLLEYCPLLLLSAKQYYMSFNNDICECGIACGDEFRIPEGINLSIRRIPQGSYAMLADDCFGDIRSGEMKVNRWLESHSIAHEEKPFFVVYNMEKDKDELAMCIYKKLKDVNNG